MDSERRKFLAAAGAAGVAGLAGCAYLVQQLTSDDSPPDGEETPTDTPTDTPGGSETPTDTPNGTDTPEDPGTPVEPPEGGLVEQLIGDPTLPSKTAPYMQYLPARDGEAAHPPLYDGGPVFEEETELVISSYEDLDDELSDGEFNRKIGLYQPLEYLTFAAKYWEKSLDNLTVTVETPRIGEEAPDNTDVRVKWMTPQDFFDARNGLGSQRIDGMPITYKKSSGTVGSEMIDVNLMSFITSEISKHSLITSLGRAFGIEYAESGVMSPRFEYNPQVGQEVENSWRNGGADEAARGIVDTGKSARQSLIQGNFDEARTAAKEAKQRINGVPELFNPVLQQLINEDANYAVLALYELTYFLDTNMRSVFDHIIAQADKEEATYNTGDQPPNIHAYKHKYGGSIKPQDAIQASMYESWVGVDLELRIGIEFDPDEHPYYSNGGSDAGDDF